jgi:hypothetical protein
VCKTRFLWKVWDSVSAYEPPYQAWCRIMSRTRLVSPRVSSWPDGAPGDGRCASTAKAKLFCARPGSCWFIHATPGKVLDPGGCTGQGAVRGRSSFPAPRSGRRIGYVMSMQPAAWPESDPQITAAIASMYHGRKTPRPLAVQIRDRLGEWLHDGEFASAFGDRGRPGWSPSRLALVTVLQRGGEADGPDGSGRGPDAAGLEVPDGAAAG